MPDAPKPNEDQPQPDQAQPEQPDGGGDPDQAAAAAQDAQPAVAGLTEQQIRDQGGTIDVPYEAPDPGGKPLVYGEGTAQPWEPAQDLQMGGVPWTQLPPIDPQLAQGLGLTDGVTEEGTPDANQDGGVGE